MRSPEAIAAEALSLPVSERAALVLRLAESLDEQYDDDDDDLGQHQSQHDGATSN